MGGGGWKEGDGMGRRGMGKGGEGEGWSGERWGRGRVEWGEAGKGKGGGGMGKGFGKGVGEACYGGVARREGGRLKSRMSQVIETEMVAVP